MAARPRLQRREYQTRIVLWNLLALTWLAVIAATGVLITQAHAKALPIHLRITHQPPAQLQPMFSADEVAQMFLSAIDRGSNDADKHVHAAGGNGLVEAQPR